MDSCDPLTRLAHELERLSAAQAPSRAGAARATAAVNALAGPQPA